MRLIHARIVTSYKYTIMPSLAALLYCRRQAALPLPHNQNRKSFIEKA